MILYKILFNAGKKFLLLFMSLKILMIMKNYLAYLITFLMLLEKMNLMSSWGL